MPMIKVGDSELFAETRGERGDPMVLVHGSWVDHRTWNLVVPKLAESFSVVVYDRRGHGRSPPRAGPYRPADDAVDLEGVLTAMDHYPAHVVGLSLGGNVALRLAGDRPDLFRSLVVHEPPIYSLLPVDSPARRSIQAKSQAIAERLSSGDRPGAAEEFVDGLAAVPGEWQRLGRTGRDLMVAHAERWLAEFHGAGTFGLELAPLAEFYAPALLTNGRLGPPVFGEILDRLAPALPNAQRLTLPETGHLPHLTDPDQFVGMLFSFCAERNVPVS